MKEKRNKTGNVPNLRFKGFEGEWETKKLGDVMEFKVTNSYSRENLNYEVGAIKNIHYGDIHTKFQTLFDITKERVPFVNNEIPISKISKDNYCKEGDIVFADASEDLNDVGKSIEIVSLNNENLIAGLHTILARPRIGYFKKGFSGYLFTSKDVRTQIQKESQGTKVLSISAGRLSKIKLHFPTDFEQQKIASFLTMIDDRIATQSKIVENLETLIQGLREKLFTQKLRFKDENGQQFPDWEDKRLKEISQEIKRIADNQNIDSIEVLTISSGSGFVRQQDRFNQIIAGQSLMKYTLLKKQEFSYNRGASKKFQFGCIYSLKTHNRALVPNIYISFSLHTEYYPEFYSQLFSTGFANQQLRQFISSSVRLDGLLNINRNDFFSIKIPVSYIDEQVKIGSLLSTVDKKIETEKAVLDQYKNQKKFLLQNLFI